MVEMNSRMIKEIIRQVHREDYEARCQRFHTKMLSAEKISGMPAANFRAEYAAVLMLIGPLISELNARQIAKMLTRSLALTSSAQVKEQMIAMKDKTIAVQSQIVQTLADELGVTLPGTVPDPVH